MQQGNRLHGRHAFSSGDEAMKRSVVGRAQRCKKDSNSAKY